MYTKEILKAEADRVLEYAKQYVDQVVSLRFSKLFFYRGMHEGSIGMCSQGWQSYDRALSWLGSCFSGPLPPAMAFLTLPLLALAPLVAHAKPHVTGLHASIETWILIANSSLLGAVHPS